MRKRPMLLLSLLLITTALLAGCTPAVPPQPGLNPVETRLAEVHLIDVGQGDSILIKTRNKAVLIDAGEQDKGDEVVLYLQEQGVAALDLVISTHPHSDHIGGLPLVLRTLPVARIIDSAVPHSSQIYLDYLTLIEQQGIAFEQPDNQSIDLGGDVRLEILGPVKQYRDLNNSSVVARLVAGKTSVLFTGDMEQAAETDLLDRWDLQATILKVGHHGSDTSSGSEFLQEVDPELAVISVGAQNSYGHPDEATLSRLSAAEVARTDQAGTIVLAIDNDGYSLLPASSAELRGFTVYVTASGGKYHLEGCRYLNGSKSPLRLQDAIRASYAPCVVCEPPTLGK